MIYIYREKKEYGKTFLVKAESQDEVRSRLNIEDGYEFLGSLTQAEIQAIDITSFGVITA